jgi:glycosyltransferase involved in cell wall biosynthesis
MGYGAALKTGIKNSKFDTIVISDIDGSYPPKHIPDLINIYEESFQEGNGYDMVVGARKGKEYDGSFMKFLFRKLLKFLVEWTTGRDIVDINSGLRVFSKKTVSNYLQQLCNTFSFTTSLTLAYMLNSKFVKYESIDYDARMGNSHVRIFRDSLRTLQYIVEAIIYYNPLKLFLLFFIFFILVSIFFLILSVSTKSILLMIIMGVSMVIAFTSLFFGFLLDLIRQNSKKN